MGASRAPTMVMAYLIARRQISLLDAYLYIQSLRSIVQPNPHFLYQLAELEVFSFDSNILLPPLLTKNLLIDSTKTRIIRYLS